MTLTPINPNKYIMKIDDKIISRGYTPASLETEIEYLKYVYRDRDDNSNEKLLSKKVSIKNLVSKC